MSRVIVIWVCFCLALWAEEKESQSPDKLKLIHADTFQGQSFGGQSLRRFVGNVKFQQGDAVLTCHRAIQYVDAGRFTLQGEVAFVDTAKSLYGEKVTYYETTEIAYVEGNVQLLDSSKTLLCDRLKYFNKEEQAFAEGNVVLIDSLERINLKGKYAEYDRERGYAKVTDDAVLTKSDSTEEDTLKIYGRVFEMFDDGDRFFVTDSVRVLRGEIDAFTDSLEYDQEGDKLTLFNQPRIHQDRQYLTGNAVALILDGSDVVAIQIDGDAVATSEVDSTLDTTVPYDLLTGQVMKVFVTDEKIDSVRVNERATSYYHVIEDGEEKGLNKALGDALFIYFDQDTLDRVRVESSPSTSVGEFYPPSHQSMLESELLEQLGKLNITVEGE